MWNFLTGWQIWQRVEVGEDSRAVSNTQADFGCVGVVVDDILSRMWPQWLSLLYVFPTIYWPISWVRKSLHSYL